MFIKRLGKLFQQILITSQSWHKLEFEEKFNSIIEQNGGRSNLLNDCEELTAYHNNNYYPLLTKYFKSHRSVLFEIIKLLPIKSSSKNNSLIKAIQYLLSCENKKSDFIDSNVDLSFINEKWRKFVITKKDTTEVFIRKNFEICIFSYISSEFKTGDLCSELSQEYAYYKNQLLAWGECQLMLNNYCSEMNLPNNPKDFMKTLKNQVPTI